MGLLGQPAFLDAARRASAAAPRVAPPRLRMATPDSARTPCTKPYERPMSSPIDLMLSPPLYRLTSVAARSLRPAPVIREPFGSRSLMLILLRWSAVGTGRDRSRECDEIRVTVVP